MNATTLMIVASLTVLLHFYISIRISSVFQPVKLELAERAAHLLRNEDLRQVDRDNINFTLDRLYSHRAAWGILVLFMALAVKGAFDRIFKRAQHQRPNYPHRKEIVKFVRLALFAILSNSPAAMALFFIVFVVGSLLHLPVKSVIFMAAFAAGRRDKETGFGSNGHAY